MNEQKTRDATGYLVIGMHNGNGPGAFQVVGIHDDPIPAQRQAEKLAKEEEGAIFGVFQKHGTARLVSNVEWREPGQ